MIEIAAKVENLRRLGIDVERFKEYQILCLPENSESAESPQELFNASDSIDLSKRLKFDGIACANSTDLGIDVPVLDRRSDDLWLGLVWVLDKLALPVLFNVVIELLSSMIRRRKRSTSPNSEQMGSHVHLSLRIQRGTELTTLKYDGDPETLRSLMNGLREEKKSETADK